MAYRAEALDADLVPPTVVPSFRRGFVTTLSLDFVARILSALGVVVLVRSLSVSNYAFMTILLTLAQLGTSGATGGVRTRYLREEAERVSRRVPAAAGAFTAALAVSVFLTLAFALIALPIAATVGFGQGTGSDVALLVYAVGYCVGWSTIELSMARMQARRAFLRAGVLNVGRAGAVAIAALVVAAGSAQLPALALWFIGLLATVGVAVAIPAVRESGIDLANLKRSLLLTSEERWLSFYYLAAAGFAYVDVLVASAMLNQGQVASFGAALRYLAVILGAMPALGVILRVRTSQSDVVDSGAAQLRFVMDWVRRGALPAIACVGTAIFAAPLIIPAVDGGRYPASVVVFQIFLVTALVTYLAAPSVPVLMAQRRYRFLAQAYALLLCANLAGDVAVAPRFGITGIAIVSTSVFVALGSIMVTAAVREAESRRQSLVV